MKHNSTHLFALRSTTTVTKRLLGVLTLIGAFHTAEAVEYVTLHRNNLSLATLPSSLVEIVGWGGGTTETFTTYVTVTFQQGNSETFTLTNFYARVDSNAYSSSAASVPAQKKLIGITSIALQETPQFFVTLKITPAAEINLAGPTSVLVIPENAQGNYDVIVESSTDLVT